MWQPRFKRQRRSAQNSSNTSPRPRLLLEPKAQAVISLFFMV
jgi:hypothetical protein